VPYPFSCTLYYGMLAAALAALPCSLAAQALRDCTPPLRPMAVTEPRMRAEYASELREEYALYFDEAQEFFRCLERARILVTDEVNEAIADYGAMVGPAPD
jgi:hypothetical protein